MCELIHPDRYNRFLFNKRYNALEKKRKVHYDYTFASDDNKEQLAKKAGTSCRGVDYWSIRLDLLGTPTWWKEPDNEEDEPKEEIKLVILEMRDPIIPTLIVNRKCFVEAYMNMFMKWQ